MKKILKIMTRKRVGDRFFHVMAGFPVRDGIFLLEHINKRMRITHRTRHCSGVAPWQSHEAAVGYG
jgi:hypothetical protein